MYFSHTEFDTSCAIKKTCPVVNDELWFIWGRIGLFLGLVRMEKSLEWREDVLSLFLFLGSTCPWFQHSCSTASPVVLISSFCVLFLCHSRKAVFSYRHSMQHDNQQNWDDIGVSGNTSKINVCTRCWEIYLYCPSVGSILSHSLSAVHPWGSKIEELLQIRTSENSSFCVYSSLFVSPFFLLQKLPLVLLSASRESMIKVNNGEFHALHIANVTASGWSE